MVINSKKTMASVLVIAFAFSMLAGCGKKKEQPQETPEPVVEEVEVTRSPEEEIADRVSGISKEQSITPEPELSGTPNSPNVDSVDEDGFTVCSAEEFTIEYDDGGVAITGYSGKADMISIPEIIKGMSVTRIAENAFVSSHLKGVKLPNSLRTISPNAFAYSTSLEKVICGLGLKAIGESAFTGCTALSNFQTNNGIQMIADNAFSECAALTEIYLPNSINMLEVGAFRGSGLTSVTVPGSLETISSHAFEDCHALTEVMITYGVINIEDNAFDNCEALEYVTIPSTTSVFGTELGVFNNCPNLVIITEEGSLAAEYADIAGIPHRGTIEVATEAEGEQANEE